MVYPDRQQTAVPDGARCQETYGYIENLQLKEEDRYVRCNAPAVMVVDHMRAEPAYYMCLEHGLHNVRNRGARFVCGRME